ncbi:MAG: excinuclease ABC subunit UvrA [Spirochaetia bacterium]|nr:excinuclease ABC subunit UvrA [Spirochaetia bacterium]
MSFIRIKGAREHNLKNISLDIPRDKLIVFTGLSGSGKSSLAFDTIYAEGQRRYIESLSSYARQFLGQLEKPDVDSIEGLSPAISIEQKTTHRNPRSTVGTVTEIYDYLRLIYARIGIPHCPQCQRELEARSVDTIVDHVLSIPRRGHEKAETFKLQILAPIVKSRKGEFKDIFQKLLKDGFVRVRVDGEIMQLEDEINLVKNNKHNIEIVIDRLVLKRKEDSDSSSQTQSRISDSMELALQKGSSQSIVLIEEIDAAGKKLGEKEELFSSKLACPSCDISFPEINHRLFSFNSPDGACPDCSGLGFIPEFHPDLLIKDGSKSIREGITQGLGWSGDGHWYKMTMERLSEKLGFSLDTPWNKLSEKFRKVILYGDKNIILNFKWGSSDNAFEYTKYYEGIIPNLHRRYKSNISENQRSKMEQFMVNMACSTCKGARLKPEPLAVTINHKSIYEITRFSIKEAVNFFDKIKLTQTEQIIAEQAMKEIKSRLNFLFTVGVGYLTMDRIAGTLSGGEAQRIRLATQIGSALVGVLYVLDEPSIGLHQSDNDKLIHTLKNLRDIGNTVIVVEHDEETIEHSDFVVDIGPGAGEHGGNVVFTGSYKDILISENSITGQYLSGRKKIDIPKSRREGNGNIIQVHGASENNLKNIDVEFPLGKFICVTGLSGSGKSTLVNEILYKGIYQKMMNPQILPGKHKKITGIEHIDKIIDIDQSAIGRTPRSNPATYTGAFTPIRDLFSELPASKMRGYKPGRFSFNVAGGRCESCEGDGVKKIEMHFLSDVYVTCKVCSGKRYNRETLEVKYKNKNIYDVLEMSIETALEFFDAIPAVKTKLKALKDVGLSYMKLGQPATTLSGGEAQRIKLATELSRRSTGKTLYILDEPTTGLHFEDIRQLLHVLHHFVSEGNTVVVIEHNMDVIKTADHIIDIGPEGGELGGQIIGLGTPEAICKIKDSMTGKYLKKWLKPL